MSDQTITSKQEGALIEVYVGPDKAAVYDPVEETLEFEKPNFKRFKKKIDEHIASLQSDDEEKDEPVVDEKPAEVVEFAGKLYEAYCVAAGGKAFNGDDLPKWAEFYADDEKKTQSSAWVVVAELAQAQVDDLVEQKQAQQPNDTLEVQNEQLRDQIKQFRNQNRNPLDGEQPSDRYEDKFQDGPDAPEQDPRLGDLTPAYVEYVRKKAPKGVFMKRYSGRIPPNELHKK